MRRHRIVVSLFMIFILTACYPFDSEDKEQLTEKEEVDQEADEKN